MISAMVHFKIKWNLLCTPCGRKTSDLCVAQIMTSVWLPNHKPDELTRGLEALTLCAEAWDAVVHPLVHTVINYGSSFSAC